MAGSSHRKDNGYPQFHTDSQSLFAGFYRLCYVMGVRTIRTLKVLARFSRALWRPFVRLVRAMMRWLRRCWRNRPRVRVSLVNLLAPLLAVVVLVLTLQFWSEAEFALELRYEDVTIGYIADEAVYAQAAGMVRDSVLNPNSTFTVDRAPEMQLAVVNDESLMESEEIRDRILSVVEDQLVSAAGLYVNGVFFGALSSKETLERYLNAVLENNRSDKYDGVSFFDEVTVVEGVYPADVLVSDAKMTSYLRSLPIRAVKNFSYTETVEYQTLIQEDPDQPLGYETVVSKGKDGKQKVFAQTIYINGEEAYETVVFTEVIKAVQHKIIKVGAQTYSEESVIGDGVATGRFVWPLPYTKHISSPFASRWGKFHGAIDIAGGSVHGKPIIASDGGVVVEAETHPSYGNYVLIDHGNGFMTRYAHCSKLEVKEGDKVAQGQYIAKVGNTGYSFGSHLHFEIIKDGVLVDPLEYVER